MSPTSVETRSAVILAPIIAANVLVMPIYVGGLINFSGLTLNQALNVVSLEMWGMALAIFPTLLLLRIASYKTIVSGALLLMTTIYLLISFAKPSYELLAAARFLGGVAAGSAMSVILAMIGQSEKPERTFAYWVLSQVIFKVIGLFVLARVLAEFGTTGFFTVLAILCVVALIFAMQLPATLETPKAKSDKFKWNSTSLLALLAIFTFYLSLSAIWANFERFGAWANFKTEDIATALALTSLAGLAGASLASVLAGKIPRLALLAIGVVLISAATLSLLKLETLTGYSVTGALFAFSWFFVVPFIVSSVNANDSTGGLMIYANSMIAFGLAIGPALAAILIEDKESKHLLLTASVIFIVSLVLLIPSNKRAPREH
jgi:DHA1 family inner membrane transport protein